MRSLFTPIPGRRLLNGASPLPGDLLSTAALAEPQQLSFDDLGTPLSEVTFVVVDLETTGGRKSARHITEIGAVKVRGGEELGHFSTLVRPAAAIPPHITRLTGISNAMVAGAPPLEEVFSTFLEFAGFERGHVLVAHNAGFDVGFLKAAAKELGYRWPQPRIVDTLHVARRVVTRQETPNYRLDSLAQVFGATTTPNHRALDDARATVDVLHALLERLGPLGITHAEDLATLTAPVPAQRRRRRSLADDLPTGPGVYLFEGPSGQILYIGTALNIRRRVRSYFTAAEKRRRIGEMVDSARAVRAISCPTSLEAQVREVRLIAEHQPAYNSRSRRPAAHFVTLTDEPHPRSVVTRSVSFASVPPAWGPYPSMRQARAAQEALVKLSQVRSCTRRLPRLPAPTAKACAALEMGRCAAPCIIQSAESGNAVGQARALLENPPASAVERYTARLVELSAQERFEQAAHERDRLQALVRGARRFEQLLPYFTAPEFTAARPHPEGGWDLALIRYGRLAGSTHLPPGGHVTRTLGALKETAEWVEAPACLAGATSAEETSLIARWCETPRARLVELVPGPYPFAYRMDGPHALAVPDGLFDEDTTSPLP